MIGIYIPAKGYLELAEGTSINIKLNNPIFADDNFIPGDFSFPFDLPGGDSSTQNANLLEHPDIPDNHKTRFEINDVELQLESNIFRKGTMLVDMANGSRYGANFRWGMKNIRDDFKSSKIRDLVDEQITISTNSYYKKVVVSWGGASLSDYSIVVNGTTFTNTTLALLATDINNDDALVASFVNTGSTYGISGDRIEVEPAADPTDPETEFTVQWEDGVNTTGWSITSNPFTNFYNDYKVFLDAYYGGTPPKDYIKFPLLWNFYVPSGSWLHPNKVNEPTASSYNFGRLTGAPVRGAAFAPFVQLSHVFDQITAEFGIQFDGDFFDEAEFANALFYHNHAFFKDVMYVKGYEYRFYDAVYNLRYCVPDITVETLLKGLQKKFNLSIVWKENINTVRINRRKPVMISKNYTDWTNLVSNPKDITYTDTTNGYKLQAAVDDTDETDTDDTYVYGDGSKTISSEFGSIKEDTTISGFTGPIVKQPMDGKFIPRLIFYKGINTGGSIDYQEASRKGMEVDYAGTGALGESQWLEYLVFLSKRKIVQFDAQLEYRHLNDIDWEQKVRIFGDDYLIKSIDTQITTKKVETSKVELYKV